MKKSIKLNDEQHTHKPKKKNEANNFQNINIKQKLMVKQCTQKIF